MVIFRSKPYEVCFDFILCIHQCTAGTKIADTYNAKKSFIWLIISQNSVHGQGILRQKIMVEGAGGAKLTSSASLLGEQGNSSGEEEARSRIHYSRSHFLQEHPDGYFSDTMGIH